MGIFPCNQNLEVSGPIAETVGRLCMLRMFKQGQQGFGAGDSSITERVDLKKTLIGFGDHFDSTDCEIRSDMGPDIVGREDFAD
jgi:hypothetical protein